MDNVLMHGSMFAEVADQQTWKKKTLRALETLVPQNGYEGLSALPRYTSHDCEYITPGLNGLWFGLNALGVLEQIVRYKFPDAYSRVATNWPERGQALIADLTQEIQDL